jgi:hypothetical protein
VGGVRLLFCNIPDNIFRNCNIHLCALSTGKSHPSAASPVLHVTGLSSADWCFNVKIFDHFVGVMFIPADGPAADLIIYDWISGEIILVIFLILICYQDVLLIRENIFVKRWQHLFEDMRCFAFLDGDLVMVAMIATETDARLGVYNLKPAPYQQSFICVFHFPEGAQDSIIIDLSISSDTSPWLLRRPAVPFSVSFQDKLFTVTYETLAASGETTLKALLFLPMSTILGHLNKRWADAADREIPWHEWGPHGTRFVFLDHELSSVWICHTYGMKFVLACKPSPADQSQSICLYDFNKLTAGRDSLLPATKALMTSSVIRRSDHMFDELVYTHLPCRCSWNDLPMCDGDKYEAVMMSEDSLIAVAVGHLVHSFSSFLF